MDGTKLARLIDLPNELLKLIVDDLPDDATYNFATTCKDLHFCVLPIFLERNDLKISSSERVSLFKPSKVALVTFGRSLFTQKLRNVSSYPNADVTRLLPDLRTLRRMVANMPQVTELTLRYSSFDWLVNSTRYHDQAHLNMQNWRLEFVELLDAALAKSCKRLMVYGANHFSLRYSDRSDHSHQIMNDSKPVAARASIAQLGQISGNHRHQYAWHKLLSIFWKAGYNATTTIKRQPPSTPPKSKDLVTKSSSQNFRRSIDQLTPPPSSLLTKFHIHSQMLLQPPLLDWTQSRLQLSAATLTDLSFNVDSISLRTWTIFLPELNLPALRKFEFTCDLLGRPTGVRFFNIAAFLIRHTLITTLHLYGLIIPHDLSNIRQPILLRLTSLIAPPSLIAWLFAHRGSTVYRPFPSVMITSKFNSFKYDLFDGALIALAHRAESDVRLGLRFVSKHGVQEWMQKHISLGHPGSCISSLERVLETLPSFLALFPSLEDVDFAEELLWVAPLKADLVKEVGISCPKVKTFSVNAWPTSLEE